MKVGDYIYTPRFCNVRINAVYDNRVDAVIDGYTEPTHYHSGGWAILGKSLDVYHMEFAAVKED